MSGVMDQTLPNPLPVFHDRDCDLSILRGKRVAVIGYGSQGRTHALNLRDSGVTDIVVGLKVDSKTRALAQADGFPVLTARLCMRLTIWRGCADWHITCERSETARGRPGPDLRVVVEAAMSYSPIARGEDWT